MFVATEEPPPPLASSVGATCSQASGRVSHPEYAVPPELFGKRERGALATTTNMPSLRDSQGSFSIY
jgi:hypothetical protein